MCAHTLEHKPETFNAKKLLLLLFSTWRRPWVLGEGVGWPPFRKQEAEQQSQCGLKRMQHLQARHSVASAVRFFLTGLAQRSGQQGKNLRARQLLGGRQFPTLLNPYLKVCCSYKCTWCTFLLVDGVVSYYLTLSLDVSVVKPFGDNLCMSHKLSGNYQYQDIKMY